MKLMDLSTIRSNLVENKNNTSFFTQGFKSTIHGELPIKPVKTDWESIDGCLCKTFYFDKVQNMKLFVEKLIIKMEKMFHHCRFSVFEYEVEVVLTTKILGDISQQDKDLSIYLDEIYFDIESLPIEITGYERL
jgi:pterin-4a-carbinolamine dehydratase